ncbi:MAG: hypothetical protein ACTS5A_03420, partial [Candidatus Hodgkinia cicadicola]
GKQTSTEASAESPVSPTSSAEAAPSPEVAKQAPSLPPNSSTQQLSIKPPPQVPKVVPHFKTLVSLKLGFVKSNSQTVSKVLNIKLSPGELSILMGRNAAGKSTLVSALTAAGKFEVSGRGPSALSDFRTIVRSTDRTSVRKGPARYNISLPFNTSGGLHGLRRSSHTF